MGSHGPSRLVIFLGQCVNNKIAGVTWPKKRQQLELVGVLIIHRCLQIGVCWISAEAAL